MQDILFAFPGLRRTQRDSHRSARQTRAAEDAYYREFGGSTLARLVRWWGLRPSQPCPEPHGTRTAYVPWPVTADAPRRGNARS